MAYDEAALSGLIGERPCKLHIIVVRDCLSTNDIVQEFYRDPAASDAVLAITNHQKSGQGRQGRTWYSPEGKDVLLTLGLKRSGFNVPVDSRLPLAVCVLVARGIEQAAGVKLQTKWPNDLVGASERKLCGILLRNRATHFAIGVGLNVNSLPQEYPEAVRPRVATLREEAGKECDRSPIVAALARELLDFFEGNTEDTLGSLIEEWMAKTATFAHSIFLHQDNTLVEVTPLGLIAETGELVVRHEDGREETLSSAALIES